MTTPFHQLDIHAQVEALQPLVRQILAQYPLGQVVIAESINHEYNSTFAVQTDSGQKYALRVNINSARTPENLSAELWWMSQIQAVRVPKPVATQDGRLSTSVWFEPLQRRLHAVLFEWLGGQEVGDEPTSQQLQAMGVAMASLHLEAASLTLPAGALLPNLRDPWWGEPNLLASPSALVDETAVKTIDLAQKRIGRVIDALYETHSPQLIHADLHGWNVMWDRGKLAVIDFDDCGIGLRHQDLATALYYLDTDDQEDSSFLQGYESVTALPEGFMETVASPILQRRLHLLNFIVGSSNPEHRSMVPAYLAETIRRCESYLSA